MNAIAFDTLRFSKRLQAAGYSPEQANAQAEAYSEAVGDALAGKSDLDHAIVTVRSDVENATASLRAEIRDMRAALRTEIRESNLTLIKWLVPLLLGQTALVAALVRLF